MIPASNNNPQNTRYENQLHYSFVHTNSFRNSFFPYTVTEWNKLDNKIKSLTYLELFKIRLFDFVRPSKTNNFGIHDPVGLKLLTRLRLTLSHLRAHKFKHNFQDTLNPLCSCDLSCEDNMHFFLHCHFFVQQRRALFDRLKNKGVSVIPKTPKKILDTLLYGDSELDDDTNKEILSTTISFIKDSQRFSGSLLL